MLQSKTMTTVKKHKEKRVRATLLGAVHGPGTGGETSSGEAPEPRMGRFLRMPTPPPACSEGGASTGREGGKEEGRPGVIPGGNKSQRGDKGNEKNASAMKAN